MKRFSIARCAVIAVLMMVCSTAFAQEVKKGLTWYTDVYKAHEASLKAKKPIFAFFTGSDWCGWCHKLEAAVFDKPNFKAWAKKNVILLELDFPRNKEQSDKLKQQNGELQQFFKVEGYPTIWIFNMAKDAKTGKYNISALGQLGYPNSQPGKEEATFLDNVNQIMKNK
ncbi:MAG: thioredoxin family protein [Bacteroidetes bacterium]|nr:thioredoxin family protein [Bacteroidota bacterium]